LAWKVIISKAFSPKLGHAKTNLPNQGLQLLSRARSSLHEIGFRAAENHKTPSLAFSSVLFKQKKSLGLPLISPSVARWTSQYATHACAHFPFTLK
jgi:hypothetical protein